MIDKHCLFCSKAFSVPDWRPQAKYCSAKCSAEASKSVPNCTCPECGSAFYAKPFHLKRYGSKFGNFCSIKCLSAARSRQTAGSNNPNYKGRNVDSDGYRLHSPSVGARFSNRQMKLHQAVCFEILNIDKLPAGMHVHHRDCHTLNNEASNLAVLTVSDHKWLHKQFGNATLWAFCNGKIGLKELISWSDDPKRAERLLPLDVEKQALDTEFLKTLSV